MTPPAVFGLSVLMSFVAFGIVTRLYIWPRLQAISREGIIARNWSSRKAIPWYSLKRMAAHESPSTTKLYDRQKCRFNRDRAPYRFARRSTQKLSPCVTRSAGTITVGMKNAAPNDSGPMRTPIWPW